MLMLPNIKAGAILADPAWNFDTRSSRGQGRAPSQHYGCMSFDETKAIPVSDWAADDAFLFLWVPGPHLMRTAELMTAWRFAYSGTAFVWIKPNRCSPGFAMGCGFGTRKNAEFCLLGRRGRPQRRDMGVHELIVEPRREHSRKPDEVYARIERLCDGPYLELFARQQWPGWTSWGDEVGMFKQEVA